MTLFFLSLQYPYYILLHLKLDSDLAPAPAIVYLIVSDLLIYLTSLSPL